MAGVYKDHGLSLGDLFTVVVSGMPEVVTEDDLLYPFLDFGEVMDM